MHSLEISIPETRLWRAVLDQAYADAEQPQMPDAPEPLERMQARRFLRADTSHDHECLKDVCESADVPLDRVVNWARKQYRIAA